MDHSHCSHCSHCSHRSSRSVEPFAEWLRALPIGRHPALYFDPFLQGFEAFTFGGSAGGDVSVSHLAHELAHAAEFGAGQFARRTLHGSFGFRLPRRTVLGQSCIDCSSAQASQREMRTLAMQMHLLQAAQGSLDVQAFTVKAVSALRFMPDWIFVPGQDDQDRLDQACAHVMQLHGSYSSAHVLQRLQGWLDKMLHSTRLRRFEPENSFRQVVRMHADGHARVWSQGAWVQFDWRDCMPGCKQADEPAARAAAVDQAACVAV